MMSVDDLKFDPDFFCGQTGIGVKTCFPCDSKHKFPYKLLTALWPSLKH